MAHNSSRKYTAGARYQLRLRCPSQTRSPPECFSSGAAAAAAATAPASVDAGAVAACGVVGGVTSPAAVPAPPPPPAAATATAALNSSLIASLLQYMSGVRSMWPLARGSAPAASSRRTTDAWLLFTAQ